MGVVVSALGRQTDAIRDAEPILRGEQRLATWTPLVQALYLGSGATPLMFDQLYRPVLIALAAYIQVLPDPADPQTPWIATRLALARRVLSRRQGLLLPKGAAPEDSARQADLWTWVVVSLALVRGLGSVVHVPVDLCDAQPAALGRWQPWAGGLAETGAVGYRLASPEAANTVATTDWTPLLVKRLLPPRAWTWLQREPELWLLWCTALRGPLPPPLKPLFEP